ncbi:MAG: IclR family transcriptional regulator [Chloroflexota bacterium]|nr:IclR family transcriptional regulator [Chloroflexota bacterium]
MRTESRTVNDSVDVDAEGRGATLAPAVTRAAAILDALAEAPSAPTALSDLARRLGLPKSSVANICAALVDARLIRRADQGFQLGRRLAELGGAYLATVDEVQEFYDLAGELPVASQETTQLALLDGLEVTYVARHDGRQAIRLASEIGRRLPASCTALGKATLASLDPADLAERLRGVEALPSMTRNSHRRVADLLDDLDEVRRRGYAIDNEETAEGILCLGVAIPRRRSGGDPYGVSVTLLKARADDARLEALAADLKRLAGLLSNPLIVRRAAGDRAVERV